MPALPSANARSVVRALKRAGFVEDRQRRSHLVLVHPATRVRTIVPIYGARTIKQPLLRAILREAGLTAGEFLALL